MTTAREYVPYGTVTDGVTAAAKSDSALPPIPEDAELLAHTIKDAAVEKPTAIGPTPEFASAISGKTYKFPENDLGLKSLTLFLTGPNPHLEYELALKYPPNSSATYVAPIGLDGFFRKGSPTLSGMNPVTSRPSKERG